MNNFSPKDEYAGKDAIEFAAKHLKKVKVDQSGWITEYVHPETGEKWELDYPNSEEQGGGMPRLRKIL
jgi:hypothetical protein